MENSPQEVSEYAWLITVRGISRLVMDKRTLHKYAYSIKLKVYIQSCGRVALSINIMTPVADLFKTLDCSVLKDINILVTGGASGLRALIATSFVEYGYGTMQSGHKQSQHGAELQYRRYQRKGR